METKEQMLYRINRINKNNLMNELNMKRKKLIVKYNPKEKNIDELPKSQREFINYKKKFNKQILKNKQIMNPDFINISSFKPEERKLIVGDKDEELIGSLLISDEVKQENYNKIDELFKKNLTPNLMDFQTYTYVNQQIGDDYVYKNMINNNIVGIEKKLRDKYKSLTPTQFLFEINKYFQEPQTSQPISSPSQYIPIMNYTPSQKLYYDAINRIILKLKGDKNTLSKYKKKESNINDTVLQNLITEYNTEVDNGMDLVISINETIQKYNDELNEIPKYKDDDITEFLNDFNNRIQEIEKNYNNINEKLFNIDEKIKKRNKQFKGVEKISQFMDKKNIKNKYNYFINKLKEIRDNQEISEAMKNMFDDNIAYLEITKNNDLSDENKEDILMDEVKDINEVLINNNIEPIKLSEQEEEIKKMEKLIGSIEKSQKRILKYNFLKKLNEYVKKNNIIINENIKDIMERAIEIVDEIESNKDLTKEEKEKEVNNILNDTKKDLTNREVILQTNLAYINKLLDYAINKQPKEEELKQIKKNLNNSKNYNDFTKILLELYKFKFPNGNAIKYDIRIKEILKTYGFKDEELKDIKKDTTQNEQILDKTLLKVDDYSKSIENFIKNTDIKSINKEIKLLEKVDKIITERTLMDTKDGIEKYRKKIVDFYNDLRDRKEKNNFIDEEKNILYGLQNTDLPVLTQNNIMKMISIIYDVYLGNITEVIKEKKINPSKNIKATQDNIEKLFGEKKKLLDELSTEATMTEEKKKIKK